MPCDCISCDTWATMWKQRDPNPSFLLVRSSSPPPSPPPPPAFSPQRFEALEALDVLKQRFEALEARVAALEVTPQTQVEIVDA